jgi:Flp pilus assembly protein TadD
LTDRGIPEVIGFAAAAVLLVAVGVAGSDSSASEAGRLRLLEASERDFAVGLAAHKRGDLDAAVRAYGSAVEKDGDFVEAVVNLARALVDRGEFDEATRWLEHATARRPEYYAIYKVRGLLALRRGQAAHAEDQLIRALSLKGDDVEAMTNLGAALIQRGRVAEAGERLRAANRLDPGCAETVLNLALAQDLASDSGRAAFHYRRFLQLAASGHPLRGEVERRLGQLGGQRGAGVSAGPPLDSSNAIGSSGRFARENQNASEE